MVMRYLGIDFGEKRVGIAISDEEGKFAFPTAVLANDKDLLKNIVDLCMQNAVEVVVMGTRRANPLWEVGPSPTACVSPAVAMK